jgi:adenylate cyclase
LSDVFISYARADAATAARLAKSLQAAGLSVWWDADLPAHKAYSQVIESNLTDAGAVVVLWSKAAAGSEWVRAEADFARNAGKLVQARADDTIPPLPFNQIQCADLKGWKGGESHPGWAKLLSSVRAIVSGDDALPEATASPNWWQHIRQRRRWLAAAALVTLIAFAALALFLRSPEEERKPILAVLPFRSLDAQDASLVAGIWEDTRSAIGRNPQLVVLGPNTAEQLADQGEGAAKKAADYLLEASVRTAGDRVRISANLMRTTDGQQVWSQDFDRKLDDVFALQSEIAGEIEGRIRGRLAEKGGVKPEHIATTGDVYALYADARAKVRQRDGALFPAARDQLEKALKIDPNFAPGWATLAVVSNMLVPSQTGYSIDKPAEAYARKAIDLAPNLAAGHAALALSLGGLGPVARAELQRAVELDPNDYEALNWLAGSLKKDGRTKEAIETFNRAVRIEPLFWPSVLNLYQALKESHDEQGIRALLDFERGVGGDFFSSAIEMQQAREHGDLAKAANIGLAIWATGRPAAQTVAGLELWEILLQLGYADVVFGGHVGPAPPFASYLWRNDPKGLAMIDAEHLSPKTLMSITPLAHNAGRVYLVTGAPGIFADKYLALHMTPEQFAGLYDSAEGFLSTAEMVGLALNRSGHQSEADALFKYAEVRGQDYARDGTRESAGWLARLYAAEGRKDEAIALLTSAVSKGWLPPQPLVLTDLAIDPAFGNLTGDQRFERLRQQILGTIARERLQVNPRLIAQIKAA